ncbi:uncharacterized protein L201_001112 [Kwoniella dendrophila CBS 6074]|uniref:Amidohydrolase-related domain-containing protein n=1 Tax=Kwoniella dendrophila CBS 6074 TaxID=1295534 RepID=A0AAX4JMW9_9TREE
METERYIQLTNLHMILPSGELSTLTSIYIDSSTGLICSPPITSSADNGIQSKDVNSTRIIDLNGKWVSPGMVDIQINGAFGIDLSEFPNEKEYVQGVKEMCKKLLEIGVTGFLPTIISQKKEAYHSILPILSKLPELLKATESLSRILGWHLEGPFLSNKKSGCHPPSNLITNASAGIESLYDIYGKENVIQFRDDSDGIEKEEREAFVKMITLAPELTGILDQNVLGNLVECGWKVSLGHTNATTEQALQSLSRGATHITHLFNAMPPLHHREPGIIGLLGLPNNQTLKIETKVKDGSQKVVSTVPSPTGRSKPTTRVPSPITEVQIGSDIESVSGQLNADTDKAGHHSKFSSAGESGIDQKLIEFNEKELINPEQRPDQMVKRPYFSIIADGIHVHPEAISMAYNCYPEGCILVSDAMHMLDPSLPDGIHPWRDGAIEKKNGGITLYGTDTLAGSILPLSEAVKNLSKFSGISLPKSIVCATYNPINSLGENYGRKSRIGYLDAGYKADLCIWDENGLKGVWKNGKEIWYEA